MSIVFFLFVSKNLRLTETKSDVHETCVEISFANFVRNTFRSQKCVISNVHDARGNGRRF